ncbi:MAG: DMT family transporter [Paludibacteraceae bacterium]|nr:DMT family transporter [Paludibacteraceae bacterium]
MWILFAIASAFCLGFYDIAKKQSVTNNNVSYVLMMSVWVSSAILLPWFFASRIAPQSMADTLIYVPQISLHDHLFILLKSALVLSSWICAYYAMKHLPITLVTPINATRPMWTLLGAMLIFGEVLNPWQGAGIAIALISFYAFSIIGKTEGISWKHNIWLYVLVLATLLGAASGLYDKYLMRHIDRNAVLVFYTFYQAILMTLIYCAQRWQRYIPQAQPQWRWSIVAISVFLIMADFVYLLSLTDPDSLISVVSTVRRSGCIIPFIYGAIVLKDKNIRAKTICLIGVILGMICLLIGTL